MSYDNKNSGALFKNKDKSAETPTWADYQGNLNVEGNDYYISAWLKKDKNDKPYMSLSVKPKNAQKQEIRPAPENAAPANFDNFDDDIPF